MAEPNQKRIRLAGGLHRTASSAQISKEGSLVVEFYDFSEVAERHFGHDVAFLVIVSARGKQQVLFTQRAAEQGWGGPVVVGRMDIKGQASMDHDRPTHRSYNEKQIGALIQRATELHEEAMGASERGLSLEEIEHIAAELGLPPEYMRTAALELEHRVRSDRAFSLFGGPFVINQARVVDETMTEEQWEQVVMELRAFTGKKGHVDEVGPAREWIHAIGEGDEGFNFVKTRVAIRPGDGQTSIQIRKHYGGIAILYAVPFFLSVFFALVLLTEQPDLVKFAFASGSVIGAFAVVRTLISSWARREKKRLKRLANLLHRTLSASSSKVLANEPTTELVELPEMDEPEGVPVEPRRGIRI